MLTGTAAEALSLRARGAGLGLEVSGGLGTCCAGSTAGPFRNLSPAANLEVLSASVAGGDGSILGRVAAESDDAKLTE